MSYINDAFSGLTSLLPGSDSTDILSGGEFEIGGQTVKVDVSEDTPINRADLTGLQINIDLGENGFRIGSINDLANIIAPTTSSIFWDYDSDFLENKYAINKYFTEAGKFGYTLKDAASFYKPLADAFEDDKSYVTGNVVVKNDEFYKANQDISSGSWDDAKWDQYDYPTDAGTALANDIEPLFDSLKSKYAYVKSNIVLCSVAYVGDSITDIKIVLRFHNSSGVYKGKLELKGVEGTPTNDFYTVMRIENADGEQQELDQARLLETEYTIDYEDGKQQQAINGDTIRITNGPRIKANKLILSTESSSTGVEAGGIVPNAGTIQLTLVDGQVTQVDVTNKLEFDIAMGELSEIVIPAGILANGSYALKMKTSVATIPDETTTEDDFAGSNKLTTTISDIIPTGTSSIELNNGGPVAVNVNKSITLIGVNASDIYVKPAKLNSTDNLTVSSLSYTDDDDYEMSYLKNLDTLAALANNYFDCTYNQFTFGTWTFVQNDAQALGYEMDSTGTITSLTIRNTAANIPGEAVDLSGLSFTVDPQYNGSLVKTIQKYVPSWIPLDNMASAELWLDSLELGLSKSAYTNGNNSGWNTTYNTIDATATDNVSDVSYPSASASTSLADEFGYEYEVGEITKRLYHLDRYFMSWTNASSEDHTVIAFIHYLYIASDVTKNTWKENQAYRFGSVVVHDNKLYKATQTTTGQTFAKQLAAKNCWEKDTTVSQYAATNSYKQNDSVVYNNVLYTANKDVASGSASFNSADWDSDANVTEWNITIAYDFSHRIINNNQVYRAVGFLAGTVFDAANFEDTDVSIHDDNATPATTYCIQDGIFMDRVANTAHTATQVALWLLGFRHDTDTKQWQRKVAYTGIVGSLQKLITSSSYKNETLKTATLLSKALLKNNSVLYNLLINRTADSIDLSGLTESELETIKSNLDAEITVKALVDTNYKTYADNKYVASVWPVNVQKSNLAITDTDAIQANTVVYRPVAVAEDGNDFNTYKSHIAAHRENMHNIVKATVEIALAESRGYKANAVSNSDGLATDNDAVSGSLLEAKVKLTNEEFIVDATSYFPPATAEPTLSIYKLDKGSLRYDSDGNIIVTDEAWYQSISDASILSLPQDATTGRATPEAAWSYGLKARLTWPYSVSSSSFPFALKSFYFNWSSTDGTSEGEGDSNIINLSLTLAKSVVAATATAVVRDAENVIVTGSTLADPASRVSSIVAGNILYLQNGTYLAGTDDEFTMSGSEVSSHAITIIADA